MSDKRLRGKGTWFEKKLTKALEDITIDSVVSSMKEILSELPYETLVGSIFGIITGLLASHFDISIVPRKFLDALFSPENIPIVVPLANVFGLAIIFGGIVYCCKSLKNAWNSITESSECKNDSRQLFSSDMYNKVSEIGEPSFVEQNDIGQLSSSETYSKEDWYLVPEIEELSFDEYQNDSKESEIELSCEKSSMTTIVEKFMLEIENNPDYTESQKEKLQLDSLKVIKEDCRKKYNILQKMIENKEKITTLRAKEQIIVGNPNK
jgi:hypothetical protein